MYEAPPNRDNSPNQARALTKDEQLKKLMLKFEISQGDKLKKLKDFKIVFIFDDSTSMNTSNFLFFVTLFIK